LAQAFTLRAVGAFIDPRRLTAALWYAHREIFRHCYWVVMQFECGTRILRVIHGRDARATPSNCTTTLLLHQ